MNMGATVIVDVLHGTPVVLIGVQPGKRNTLEIVQHSL